MWHGKNGVFLGNKYMEVLDLCIQFLKLIDSWNVKET